VHIYVPPEEQGGGRTKLGSLFDQAPLQISQYGKDYARFQTGRDLNRQQTQDPKNPCGGIWNQRDCEDTSVPGDAYCYYRLDCDRNRMCAEKCITRWKTCKDLSKETCEDQTGAFGGSPDGKYTGEVSCHFTKGKNGKCKERKVCKQKDVKDVRKAQKACESRYIKGEQCQWKSKIKRCISRQGKRRKGMDYDYETSNEPVEKVMDYKQEAAMASTDYNSVPTAGGWMRQDCANPDWQKSPFCNCVATCPPGDFACEGGCNASYGGIGASSQMGVMGKRLEESAPLVPQDIQWRGNTGFQG